MNKIGEIIYQNLKTKYYSDGRTDKFKILFCPYKDEMWDSMQTIYEAAIKDSQILAKIMPIPYYTLQNLKPKGIRIEYENDKHNFPDALDSEKWDVIIFHYPYDNCNTLTRPLLFSTDLKAFCKHLVLVGYACVGGRLPTLTETSIPGVRNADLVVWENEEAANEAQKQLSGKSNAECVGWGSAKYDCVFYEHYHFPMAWRKKSEGKKKILLQSSIVPYMNCSYKLDQIEQVIQKYEKQTNYFLLWRFHPLYRTTILAHRPHELIRFNSLVTRVNNMPNGCIDEEEMPEKSIVFCDEMISDGSSLVHLWNKTGKKLTLLDR